MCVVVFGCHVRFGCGMGSIGIGSGTGTVILRSVGSMNSGRKQSENKVSISITTSDDKKIKLVHAALFKEEM